MYNVRTECTFNVVYQALKYMGTKLRVKRFWSGPKKSKLEEARETMQGVVLAHVPVRTPESTSTRSCVTRVLVL